MQPTSGGYVTALNPKTALNPREGFGSLRRGEDMVVEIFYPGGVPDERFRIGSNADTEQVSVIGFHRYDGLPGCDANLDGRVDGFTRRSRATTRTGSTIRCTS